MRYARRFLAAGLVVAVGSAVLAACGQPEYEYVRNTEARTAFKVPHEWTIFDEAAMQGDPSGPQASTPDPVEWLVGLDGDPSPAREHILSPAAGFATTHPQGIAGVYRLSSSVRDQVNIGVLRNLIIPFDQIIDQVGSEALEMKAYDDRLELDGYRGLHLEAQVAVTALEAVGIGSGGSGAGAGALLSDEYVHINQTAYMDPSSDKVYILAVLCSAECYERNRGDIETVVESWAVIA
jgi:hypothetical protein